MEWLTLAAAVIAAGASILAAVQASRNAAAIQQKEHEHQDRTRNEERCHSLQSKFLKEIRGADLPPIEGSEFSSPKLQVVDSMGKVAKGCIERSGRADHVAAEIRMFCDEAVTKAADHAVESLRNYGYSIIAFLLDDESSPTWSEGKARMLAAADTYRATVADYEAEVKGHGSAAEPLR